MLRRRLTRGGRIRWKVDFGRFVLQHRSSLALSQTVFIGGGGRGGQEEVNNNVVTFKKKSVKQKKKD